jgi:FMN phosphatase YigB (HAD superfamily)
MMAAYFFDIDGTLVKYHTNIWLEGAREYINELYSQGNQIHFITMRDSLRDFGKEWSPKRTEETILKDLDEDGVKYKITYDVQSPRTIYDDSNCYAIKRKQNDKW